MRIVKGFLTHKTPDGIIAVATGEAATRFTGMMRLNDTAALIVDTLGEEVTLEELVNVVTQTYEVSRETAEADITAILDTLRTAGLLVE